MATVQWLNFSQGHWIPSHSSLWNRGNAYSCPSQALSATFYLTWQSHLFKGFLAELPAPPTPEVNSLQEALADIHQACASHVSIDQKLLEAPSHSEHRGVAWEFKNCSLSSITHLVQSSNIWFPSSLYAHVGGSEVVEDRTGISDCLLIVIYILANSFNFSVLWFAHL